VWLLLSMVVFAIVHVLPGDAIDALVPAEVANDPAMRAALEKELGLSSSTVSEQSLRYIQWCQEVTLFPMIQASKLIALQTLGLFMQHP